MCYGSLGFVKGLSIRWKILLVYTIIVPRGLPIPLMIRVHCRLPIAFLLLKLLPRLYGYFILFHLPVVRNARLCMTCSWAQPDTPTISHFRAGFRWQWGQALEPLCVQKRIQTQTEQVDLKVSGFSKGIPVQAAPGRTLKAFIPFADNLQHIMPFVELDTLAVSSRKKCWADSWISLSC